MTDKSSLNLMQRTFDALAQAPGMLPMEAIAERLRVDVDVVARALQRLRKYRCVRSVCIDGEWRYGLRADALRPIDRRGQRQMAQELAA